MRNVTHRADPARLRPVTEPRRRRGIPAPGQRLSDEDERQRQADRLERERALTRNSELPRRYRVPVLAAGRNGLHDRKQRPAPDTY
jgi:hypothetical protein